MVGLLLRWAPEPWRRHHLRGLVARRSRNGAHPGTDDGVQLEFLRATCLRTAGYISNPRISPAGDGGVSRSPAGVRQRGFRGVVDRLGQKKNLTRQFSSTEGLAWSSNGSRSGSRAPRTGQAGPVGRHARRPHAPGASAVGQHCDLDVSPDGKALITTWNGARR